MNNEKSEYTEKIIELAALGYSSTQIREVLRQPPYNKLYTDSAVRYQLTSRADEVAQARRDLLTTHSILDPLIRVKILEEVIQIGKEGVEVFVKGGGSYMKYDLPAVIAAVKEINNMQGYAENKEAESKIQTLSEELKIVKEAFDSYRKSNPSKEGKDLIDSFRVEIGPERIAHISDKELLA